MRLRIRIGDAEFDGEGEEQTIREQYQLFLEALSSAPPQREPISLRANPQQQTDNPTTTTTPPPAPTGANGGDFDQSLLERAFAQTKDIISLRHLPEGRNREADALLALLYGYLKLKGERDVYGVRLMKAAIQSGLSIDRVDRVIAAHRGYFIRGGARRGAHYSLNNQGERKVEQVLRDMYK